MDSTTSRSCLRGARATPTTSTSPGSSATTASSSRCSPRRWTASSRRPRPGIIGRLGGLGVLNLEGIWTPLRGRRVAARAHRRPAQGEATREMQEIYREPIKPELIAQRIARDQGAGRRRGRLAHAAARPLATTSSRSTPGSTSSSSRARSSRPSTSRETTEPLNLKEFIREVDVPVVVGGCASYHTGLHLMRTGAAGVLVGVGPGAACTTRGVLGIGVPQATAIADVAAARSQHMLETGEYVKVIADGGMRTGGDVSKAIACGADAVMVGSPLARAYEAPGRGYHWGMATFHAYAAARRARADGAERDARGDPHRPRARERRHVQPDGRAAHLDGDLRLQGHRRVQPRRADDRPRAADRGQAAAARAGRRHGRARREQGRADRRRIVRGPHPGRRQRRLARA